MGFSDWDDRLTRALVRPPFRDPLGRKGIFTPFTRAPAHKVVRLAFTLPDWPLWSRPLRIAFLSDFHVGSYADDVARLRRIVAEAASYAPDLVLYGGDFVNMIPYAGGRVPPEVVATILASLPAPLGRIAVIGNHDRNYGWRDVEDALRGQGIDVFNDESRSLTHEGLGFAVAGLPDARVHRPSAEALLGALQPHRPTLVLAHDPYWFRYLPSGPHLMLAGHTHGGQLCLPLIGPLRNASHAPLRWSYGLIEEEGRRMYVTSGLGCSGIPLRLNMPPEFAIVEIAGR